jgi:ferredoxin
MKAIVDQDACIGCGLCESTCPEVFSVEDGKSNIIAVPVPEAAQENCEKAAEGCPVQCITIEK